MGSTHIKGRLPTKLLPCGSWALPTSNNNHNTSKSLHNNNKHTNPSILIDHQFGGTFLLTWVNNWDACGTVLFCTGSHHRCKGCSGDFTNTCGKSRILTKWQILHWYKVLNHYFLEMNNWFEKLRRKSRTNCTTDSSFLKQSASAAQSNRKEQTHSFIFTVYHSYSHFISWN